MSFKIVYGNILEQKVDAIVNPTDQRYSGGGGVDWLIHYKAGEGLSEATSHLGRLHLGEARATGAFDLPFRYIIHTSGPSWRGNGFLEISLLGSCYRNSILLAKSLGCTSIAFPLISSKGKHFPKEIALSTAIDAINESLYENEDIDVLLVIYKEKSDENHWEEDDLSPIMESIQEYIEGNYVSSDSDLEAFPEAGMMRMNSMPVMEEATAEYECSSIIDDLIENPTQKNLDKLTIDEDFATTLSHLMQECNVDKESSIYDELGMSKTGFWKIRTGRTNPTRLTVFAIAIALKLNLAQTEDLLMKAGYAINKSSIQEIVLSALIDGGIYDRYTIDELLYSLDLSPLPGAVF